MARGVFDLLPLEVVRHRLGATRAPLPCARLYFSALGALTPLAAIARRLAAPPAAAPCMLGAGVMDHLLRRPPTYAGRRSTGLPPATSASPTRCRGRRWPALVLDEVHAVVGGHGHVQGLAVDTHTSLPAGRPLNRALCRRRIPAASSNWFLWPDSYVLLAN